MIQRARRRRKELGAGMRQSGILAAGGIYALEHHLPDLQRDHSLAQYLAEGLGTLSTFDVPSPQTNIVLIHVVDHTITTKSLLDQIQSLGVAMVAVGPHTIRATVHRDLNTREIDEAISIMKQVLT